MKSDKIKIAKFLTNKINNPEKITGGFFVSPNMVSSVLGESVVQNLQSPESPTFNSCPIDCSCNATESNGCIQGSGYPLGEGN